MRPTRSSPSSGRSRSSSRSPACASWLILLALPAAGRRLRPPAAGRPVRRGRRRADRLGAPGTAVGLLPADGLRPPARPRRDRPGRRVRRLGRARRCRRRLSGRSSAAWPPASSAASLAAVITSPYRLRLRWTRGPAARLLVVLGAAAGRRRGHLRDGRWSAVIAAQARARRRRRRGDRPRRHRSSSFTERVDRPRHRHPVSRPSAPSRTRPRCSTSRWSSPTGWR